MCFTIHSCTLWWNTAITTNKKTLFSLLESDYWISLCGALKCSFWGIKKLYKGSSGSPQASRVSPLTEMWLEIRVPLVYFPVIFLQISIVAVKFPLWFIIYFYRAWLSSVCFLNDFKGTRHTVQFTVWWSFIHILHFLVSVNSTGSQGGGTRRGFIFILFNCRKNFWVCSLSHLTLFSWLRWQHHTFLCSSGVTLKIPAMRASSWLVTFSTYIFVVRTPTQQHFHLQQQLKSKSWSQSSSEWTASCFPSSPAVLCTSVAFCISFTSLDILKNILKLSPSVGFLLSNCWM